MRFTGLLFACALLLGPAVASADTCLGGGRPPGTTDLSDQPWDLLVPPEPADLSKPADMGMLGFGRGRARRVGGGLVLAASAGSLWLVLRRRSTRRDDDAR